MFKSIATGFKSSFVREFVLDFGSRGVFEVVDLTGFRIVVVQVKRTEVSYAISLNPVERVILS
jgi:hypothetical protein